MAKPKGVDVFLTFAVPTSNLSPRSMTLRSKLVSFHDESLVKAISYTYMLQVISCSLHNKESFIAQRDVKDVITDERIRIVQLAAEVVSVEDERVIDLDVVRKCMNHGVDLKWGKAGTCVCCVGRAGYRQGIETDIE